MTNIAFTDTASIVKEAKSICAARGKLVDRIQVLALSVIAHLHTHGDVTVANTVCLAVGKGMKHEALKVYLSKFGCVNPNSDTKAKTETPLVYDKSKRVDAADLPAKLAEAALMQWYDTPTEQDAVHFTVAGSLHALLSKLDREIKAGKYQPQPGDADAILALRELASKMPKPVKTKAPEVQA